MSGFICARPRRRWLCERGEPLHNRRVGPLRGRDRERAVLARLVACAADGAGGVVMVEGAAGIGKSRLLSEAASIGASRGLLVAAGTSDELDQVTPWAPLLRALSSTSPVLVNQADLVPARALADQRLAVIEFIRDALEQASRRGPLLIIVDDVQWADPATLLALGSLPPQLFTLPVAWVLAQRPVPASPRLRGVVARLAEAGATLLHLEPLDENAAAAMAADILGASPRADVAALVARAAGNPLYLTELLRSAGETAASSGPRAAPLATVPVPASLSSAVAAHLRSLPQSATDLLKVAAILGREFAVSELAAMTGQPASQLLPPLEQALAAEVLTAAGDQLAFRHDLLRQAIYQDIPAPLRHGLHRDAATALLAQGAPLTRAATHLALGAQAGDEQAICLLVRAISELSPTSATAAADLGLRVLDLIGPADPRRPSLVAGTVGLLGWASRLEEARALGETYLRDHPQGPELAAEIQHGIRQAWSMTTHAPYPAPLPAALIADTRVPARLRAHLIVFEQSGALWHRPEQEARQELGRAAALLEGSDDEAGLGLLAGVRVGLAHEHGHLLEALDIARPTRARSGSMPPGLGGGLAESTTASCLRALGCPREALAVLAAAQQAAQQSGHTYIIGRCLSIRALVLLELGRLDDAQAEAQNAARATEELGLGYFLGQALATLAETAIRQGNLAAAEAAAARLAASRHPDPATGDHYWAAALCADARGRAELALARLAPVSERLRRNRFYFAAWYPSRLCQLTGIAMRAGDRQQAEVAASAAAELARRNPAASALAAAATHARGCWQSDPAALRDAVALLAEGDRPLATAAAQEDLGRVLAGAGDNDGAVASFEAAYAAYLAANASRDLARVRSALHTLGVRKRRATVARPDHGWASLTAAELAVVRIVAEGRTNRETAAQLYLSVDTVNTHLRHAFTKLGIRSRVELTRLTFTRLPQS